MIAPEATLQTTHAALKERHRALSWLHRASQCHDDVDARLIFVWIAFNAAYAQEIPRGMHLSQQESFRSFLHKLDGLDAHKQLHTLVWNTFNGPIRVLLANAKPPSC